MTVLVHNPWLAILLPFCLAGVLALFGRLAKAGCAVRRCGCPCLGHSRRRGLPDRVEFRRVCASGAMDKCVGLSRRGRLVQGWGDGTEYRLGRRHVWLPSCWSWSGVVALMVMVFSAGYMAGDRGWVRYYALLCLFTGSMTLLVIGDSFTSLFVGWELVGACSYLLIGFWYEKPSASPPRSRHS